MRPTLTPPVGVPSAGHQPLPAPPAPSCATCPYAKTLHCTVYCALDEHLRNLPYSFGHLFDPPRVQQVPPTWCPRR